ncbi:hypothetical protein AK812_SmicGene12865 [Symbiodinium microadriaticum]|uniref:PPM-type phosphatase domain-containing protein n=1 Tax=Symbiodinium microadriaticum TaxID=2951 RepID=A0A1Q9E9L9_SYMMI|nr:hypothetical protein AK812_SmicGene12865 [Symbiodinium microadriaticum]
MEPSLRAAASPADRAPGGLPRPCRAPGPLGDRRFASSAAAAVFAALHPQRCHDACYIEELPDGRLQAAVFDGHGKKGHVVSGALKELLPALVAEQLETKDAATSLVRAFEASDAALPGAAAVAAIVEQGKSVTCEMVKKAVQARRRSLEKDLQNLRKYDQVDKGHAKELDQKIAVLEKELARWESKHCGPDPEVDHIREEFAEAQQMLDQKRTMKMVETSTGEEVHKTIFEVADLIDLSAAVVAWLVLRFFAVLLQLVQFVGYTRVQEDTIETRCQRERQMKQKCFGLQTGSDDKTWAACVACAGDSRAILVELDGDQCIARQLSETSSCERAEERERIETCCGRSERSALAANEKKSCVSAASGTRAGFLLLVTDGISDVLSNDDAAQLVCDHLAEEAGDFTGACSKLVEKARELWQAGLPIEVRIDDASAVLIPLQGNA